MAWRGFEALPPYFGGKRKLAGLIFRHIAKVCSRERWPTLGLVDPFLGGGSVALLAKMQGFGVLCGDVAERSAVIGRALIENDSVRIEQADIMRLFMPQSDAGNWLQQHWAPEHMLPARAAFLDNAFAAVQPIPDPVKQDLLRLLLVKYIFRLRPHAKFSSPNAFNRPFAEGRFDDIKPTYKQAIVTNAEHPATALAGLALHINDAVRQGTQPCRALCAEAIQTIIEGEGAHVLYLDPPYAGTLSYEKEYQLLDVLLGQHLAPSPFSTEQGLDQFSALLGHCDRYPLWAISYGNAVADLDTVRGMVERYRPARAIELTYMHLGAVASEKKREANREFIILAGEGVK